MRLRLIVEKSRSVMQSGLASCHGLVRPVRLIPCDLHFVPQIIHFAPNSLQIQQYPLSLSEVFSGGRTDPLYIARGPPMPPQPINQLSNPKLTPGSLLSRTIWGRRFAVVAALVFCISSVFPVVAGLSHDTESFPAWWGPLDVSIAFVLAVLSIVIMGFAHGRVTKQAEDATYRAYRLLIHVIMAALVMFFLFGDRIVWTNCLTGLAWRAWLLFYCLPAWFTAGAPVGVGGAPGRPDVS